MTIEKIQKAREAGYSDDQIVEHIAKKNPKIKESYDMGVPLETLFGKPVLVQDGKQISETKDAIETEGKNQEEIKKEMFGETPYKPSGKEIAGAIAANIAISEGAKIAGSATGASLGAVTGPGAVVTSPVGAGVGYVVGAIGGGVAGSAAEQKILREDFSVGKAAVNSLLNLVPGGIGKITSRGKTIAKVTTELAKRPVLTNIGIGAATAPVALTMERMAEGEPVTAQDQFNAGLAASVLGAGLGASSEVAKKLLGKFAKRTPDEIDELVRKGNPDAVSYVDMLTDGIDPDVYSFKDFFNEITKTTQARLAPSTVVGRNVAEEIKESDRTVDAARKLGAGLNVRIRKFIEKSPDPNSTENLVLEYITGGQGPLPREIDEIADVVDSARVNIRKQQQNLLNDHYSGRSPLVEPLVKKIEQSLNDGDYLSREYKFFLTPSYVPSQKHTRELKAKLASDGNSPEEVEAIIANLNAKRIEPRAIDDIVDPANTASGILKRKSDLSPEMRRYLGEITEVGEKVEGTLSKLGVLNAMNTGDANIAEIFTKTGVAKVAGEGIDDPNMVPLTLRRGAATVNGEQIYVPKEVQTALNTLYGQNIDVKGADIVKNKLSDTFQSGISISKAAKVLGNIPAYFVQLYGNTSSILGMGMNPFKGIIPGVKAAAAEFAPVANRLSVKDLEDVARRKRLGLTGSGATVSDIRSGLSGVGEKVLGKPISFLGKIYSIPDVSGRNVVFESNLSFLRKAAPASSSDDVKDALTEKLASRMTNATYQNYDYLNQGLKTASRYGLLGQFAAFPLEFMRNQYNQVRIAKKMIDGSFADELGDELGPLNRKVIAQEGVKRLAALTAVYAGTIAGIETWNKESSNMTEEQIEAAKESVFPEWDKTNPLVVQKDKDGNIFYANPSYLVPAAQLATPFMAAMNGESFEDAVMKGFSSLYGSVSGEGNFIMNALVPAIQNKDLKTGRAISAETDAIDSIIERSGWFVDETFTPGVVREFNKATSTTEPQSVNQTAMRQFGLRVNKTTIDKGASFKIKEVVNSLSSLSSDMSSARFKISGEELENEYQRLNGIYRRNQEELIKHASNYQKLGLSQNEVIRLLRGNNIGAKNALAVIDGEVLDMQKAPRESITDIYDELQGDKVNAIREIAKKKPALAKSLAEKHKELTRNQRLNIDEKDKAVLSLGATDGSRAEYILKQMRKSNDPNGVLREFKRRRLVTAAVMDYINQAQNAVEGR